MADHTRLPVEQRPAEQDDRKTASGAPMPPSPAWRWRCSCGRVGDWRGRIDHAMRGWSLHATKAKR